MNCLKIISIAPLLALVSAGQLLAAVTVGQLRCEHLADPQGIDAAQPRLSWMLQSNERGVKQRAYQILVATSEARLKSGTADLWDSGRILSDESVLVPYAGKSLVSRAECFWKVRIWDGNGEISDWSKPARWSMGILGTNEWHADWIGQDGKEATNYLSGTSWIWSEDAAVETNFFRRVVIIPASRRIKRAIFEYTGDNECRGWIDQFDLGARNNFKTVKRNNITTRLEPGQTYLFGLTGRHDATGKNPAGVIGKLTIEFTEGEPLIIATDEQWKISKTPEPGWNTDGFNDAKWVAAKKLGPAEMEPWGNPRSAESRRLAARYLRKDFAVEKKISRATVSFCGLGLSELYLNGKKIGDSVLSPAFTQYDQREFYVTHDVTKNLSRGANALGVILGNGRYYADRSKTYAGTASFGFPKLRLNLRIEYADGTASEIVSDESWKLTTDGPIVANNDFDGEEYDARKELPGWSRSGYIFAASPSPLGGKPVWVPAEIVAAPGGELSAQMQEI